MSNLLNDRRALIPLLLTAFAIAVGSVLIVVLSDDASGAASPASAASQPAARGATKIDISDFKYAPDTLTVKAGTKVSWVNRDAAPHTARASGIFDTDTLKKGETKTLTLDKPGTYEYFCEFHPFMKGTVVVR